MLVSKLNGACLELQSPRIFLDTRMFSCTILRLILLVLILMVEIIMRKMVITVQNNRLGNHLYRDELINNKLINPKLLLDLPAISLFNDSEHENNHDGGKVLINPNDGNVYVAVGDIGGREGQAQNVIDGDPFDGSSDILRVGQNGEVVSDNPLATGGDSANGDKEENNNENENRAHDLADRYYAYGIRNTSV